MPSKLGLRVINQSRGTTIADRVEVAASFWARGKGLIGRKSLPEGYGLVIKPCGSIHMFFMAIPLDVLHLDREGRVLRVLTGIKPWRFGPIVRGGKSVIELPAGTAARTGTTAGDLVVVEERVIGSVDYGAA
ncbi:MAG: DUF192 domain-containing protein [Chloroflexi bacterium]|jgi:uncharacterized membrane protein (UPF0127 family)|nr:DUF192 domain-containing protein [Chloroflexota bacterium]